MYNRDNLKTALNELNRFKKSKKNKYNFYSYDNVLNNYNFDVFFSIGTRSTGKTTATQRDICLQEFYNSGSQFVKLCRYKDELRAIHQGGWWTEVVIKTLNKYNIHIHYKGNKYYINEYDKYHIDGELLESDFINEGTVIGYVIPVMRQQAYKSINYEHCANIIFDEFALLNDYSYDVNEVEHYKSLLSTIVRMRDNVKMYFIGNVLTPYNPYFLMFGIDAMKIKSGNTYTFLDTSSYDNPCIVGLEFGKSIANDIEDIPRLLRLPNNKQVTGLDEYELPVQVISSNDWLLCTLDNEDIFNEHYTVAYRLVTSIDDTRLFKKTGNVYKFKAVKYYYVEDNFNNKVYLIRCDIDNDTYGLYLTDNYNVPEYKFADEDIRNHLPIFDMSKFRGKTVIYGDTELFRILLERGVRL